MCHPSNLLVIETTPEFNANGLGMLFARPQPIRVRRSGRLALRYSLGNRRSFRCRRRSGWSVGRLGAGDDRLDLGLVSNVNLDRRIDIADLIDDAWCSRDGEQHELLKFWSREAFSIHVDEERARKRSIGTIADRILA